jgi:hypothetical protein
MHGQQKIKKLFHIHGANVTIEPTRLTLGQNKGPFQILIFGKWKENYHCVIKIK